MIERVTNGVAFLAVISGVFPALFGWVSAVSQFAALVSPILGAAWLSIKIGEWGMRKWSGAKGSADE